MPKIILSILGYTTKSSVAALKSKKSIQNLESEFLKRKNTSTLLDKHYEKYPFLRDVICFPSGLQLILSQIALCASQCNGYVEENMAEKMLNASQCKELTAANILLSENGLSCKILCPKCKKEKALSPSSGNIGTSVSFSVFNFDRHYERCKARAEHQTNEITIGTPSAENVNTNTSTGTEENNSSCHECTAKGNRIMLFFVEYLNSLAIHYIVTDMEINKLLSELNAMQKLIAKTRKIKISLCLFEVRPDEIQLNANSITLKGKLKL